MQHCYIIIQEARRVIQYRYAESILFDTDRWRKCFYYVLKLFLFFHVFNVLNFFSPTFNIYASYHYYNTVSLGYTLKYVVAWVNY